MRRKALKQKKIWNPALFGIRNPVSWNPESSTRNPESTGWNPESRPVMDSLTWGDYRPHTPELKSISKFQLLVHWRNFEKYMIFYTLPWSRWNSTHTLCNTSVVPFALAKLGQKSLEAAPTLKYEPLNSTITVLSVWIIKIFQYHASKHLKP